MVWLLFLGGVLLLAALLCALLARSTRLGEAPSETQREKPQGPRTLGLILEDGIEDNGDLDRLGVLARW